MGRRSDHTRRQLRDLCINAAIEIIEEEGVKSLSVRKVTGRIGYTIGTLYNVFSGLDGLVMHVNARTLDMLYDHAKESMLQNQAADDVEAFTHAYINFASKHFSLWSILFDQRFSAEGEIPDWYMEKIGMVFSLLEGVVESRVRDADERTLAVQVIWAGLHGICTLSLDDKDGDDEQLRWAKMLASSLVRRYLRG